MAKLRYSITHNGNTYSLEPLGLFQLTWEQENEEIFYRMKVSSSLVNGGNTDGQKLSYTTLKNIEDSEERCLDIGFLCEVFCDNTWQELYPGKFTMNDAEFNEDVCTISITILPDDLYQCIEENDSDINILNGTTPVSLFVADTNIYEFLACPDLCPPILPNGLCNGESVNSDGWKNIVENCDDIIPGTGEIRIPLDSTGGDATPYMRLEGDYLVYYHNAEDTFEVYNYATDTVTQILGSTQNVRPFDLSGDYIGFYSRQLDTINVYQISTNTTTVVRTGVSNLGNDDLAISGDYMVFHDPTADEVVLYQISTNTQTVIESAASVSNVVIEGNYLSYYRLNPNPDTLRIYEISSGTLNSVIVANGVSNLSLHSSGLFYTIPSGGADLELYHYNTSTNSSTLIVDSDIEEIKYDGDSVVFIDNSGGNTDGFLWQLGSGLVNVTNNPGLTFTGNIGIGCGYVYYHTVNSIGWNRHFVYEISTTTATQFLFQTGGFNPINDVTLTSSSVIWWDSSTMNEYEFVTATTNVIGDPSNNYESFANDCDSVGFYNTNTRAVYYYRARVGNTDKITIWYREKVSVPCFGGSPTPPPGTGWILYEDNCATTGFATYVRVPLVTPNIFVSDCTNEPNNTNQWQLIYCDGDIGYWLDLGVPTEYDRFRRLDEVMLKVAQETCPDIVGIRSDFFQINPFISNGNDTVTGEPIKVNHLLIAQKSDVKRPTSSEAASKGIITFQELTDHLLSMFQVFWFIDENDYLRFEHISYIQKTTGLDLTVDKYKEYLRGKRSYKYDVSNLQRRDVFTFMESDNVDFEGLNIEYNKQDGMKNPCVGNSDKNHDAPRFTTDIDYIRREVSLGTVEDNIADDGFVIVASTQVSATEYNIIQEPGDITGIVYNNATLSWANLQNDYWRHNRPVKDGWLNGEFVTFASVKRIKLQDEFKIPLCCNDLINFKPQQLIKATYGLGEVAKATFDNQTDMLNLELKY